jgi:hypothetical protein
MLGQACLQPIAKGCVSEIVSSVYADISQGIKVRQTCLIFEIRKRSCVDCLILEVARECFTGISERRARAETWESFDKSNPATPWLIVQVELEYYRQQCRQRSSQIGQSHKVQVSSGAMRQW